MTEASSKTQGAASGAAEPAARPAKTTATPPASKGKAAAPAAAGKQPAASVGKATVPVRAKPARRSSPVDETVDKHRKVLAEALEQAQAIQYDAPQHLKPAKAEKLAKVEKPTKVRKAKLVRDSFAMPEAEYAQIGELKKRLGGAFKKSELLRAGVAVLCALDDAELLVVMGHIERIKTGRPAKK
ncbi:MAG: hypothetical protein LBE81_07290 [Azonexus sp.]|jgi:hypothetical protein|uniref:hypothetical protein n=1 Tax=Azonexus sp. TaxID=1872668 RepID=UPI00281E6CCA|nr:hypothetical protein [Azonexus sp.]MDR0776426.1 hypothetical protein [Azonexus sp.]